MKDLTIFDFEGADIRVTDQAGESWFVLKDLLDAMGSSTPTSKAVTSVEQGLGKGYTNVLPLQTAGGEQQTIIISEPAATFLVARSNTDKGRQLNRFIHLEVLPSLRKTGSYRMAQAQHAGPVTAAPEQAAAAALDGTLRAASILGVPLHLAQIESVKAVRLAHRVDFSPLLTHAPAQSNVPELEIMLEPTELAERLGVPSARAMNAILRDAGLQAKANGEWRPTERGKSMCSRHAWSRGDKSGYNFKWRLAPVRKALAPKLVAKTA